jgi:hypothetical protein
VVPTAYRLAHGHAAGRFAAGAGRRANQFPGKAACGRALGEIAWRAAFPPGEIFVVVRLLSLPQFVDPLKSPLIHG